MTPQSTRRPYESASVPSPGVLRAVVIDDNSIIRDDGVPVGVAHRLHLEEGLPNVLDRFAAAFAAVPEATILLRDGAAAALGLPTSADPAAVWLDEDGHLSALAAKVRERGWKLSEIRPWTTYHRPESPTLHIGVLSHLSDHHRFPFSPATVTDLAPLLAWWHEMTGSAYRGTPGMSGVAILRAHHSRVRAQRVAGARNIEPTWLPKTPGKVGYELPYGLHMWQAPPAEKPHAWEHGYDVVGQHLAAMITVEVSAVGLRQTGRIEFDPRRAGWWLIEASPWWDPRLPDPMGYLPDQDNVVARWVTTPTAKLLADLAAQGVHGGFAVLDSWTGPGTRRVLKPFAERIRDGLAVLARVEHSPMLSMWQRRNLPLMRRALKQCYAETNGLFQSDGGRVCRPDWFSSVVAEARANLWRKLYRVQAATGRSPLRVDVDNVWYASDSADPVASCPPGFTLTITDEPGTYRLGRFKVSGSRMVQRDGEHVETVVRECPGCGFDYSETPTADSCPACRTSLPDGEMIR